MEEEERVKYERARREPSRLQDALEDFINDRKRNGRAAATIEMYRNKKKALCRILGAGTDLNDLRLQDTERYIDTRQSEGASNHTIHKELVMFYATIRLARRKGHFKGAVDDMKVEGFSARYVPRKRHLSREEVQKLMSALPPNRSLTLLFFVFTGASLGEARRCTRGDVDFENKVLTLPGTKREARNRRIPFGLFSELEDLLHQLEDQMSPGQTALLPKWSNIRRDLAMACEKTGIERVSPNDLRRTFGSWLKNLGLDSALVARLMGHTSVRMVDRVYGHLDDHTLAQGLGRLGELHLPVPAGGHERGN